MSLRDKINENQQVATIVAGAIVLLAVLWIGWSVFGGDGSPGAADPSSFKLFYSTDDGASYKPGPAADARKPGVVRAHVFTVDDGKTKFVGYLERWTEDGVKALAEYEAAIKAKKVGEYAALDARVGAGREVKKPKVGAWVKSNTPEGAAIVAVKGPKGEEDPTLVDANALPAAN